MEWLTDEIIFYGGIGIVICSLVVALVYFCISQIQKARLDAKLEAEYGKKE